MNWMQSHITTEDIVRASQQRIRDAGWTDWEKLERKRLRSKAWDTAIWALIWFFVACAAIELVLR